MQLDVKTTLEKFRRFIIYNTCLSFMPKGYLDDPSIFPERSADKGEIYVEAASKIELARIRDIGFVKAADVLGVIYKSRSGNTRLTWRQVRGSLGRLKGEVSANSLVNLLEARILTKEYVEEVIRQMASTAAKRGEEAPAEEAGRTEGSGEGLAAG